MLLEQKCEMIQNLKMCIILSYNVKVTKGNILQINTFLKNVTVL